MSTMIDIIGGIMIGSILLLVSMTAMDNALQQFVNHNADAIVQNELASLSDIIQDDLRKMGYAIPEAQQTQILQVADTNRVVFISNLNQDKDYFSSVHGNLHTDQIPDTVEFSVAPLDTIVFMDTSIVLYSINRRVKVSQETEVSGSIGTISNTSVFRYLNQIGQEVAYIPATVMVEVTLIAVNPNIYISDEVIEADDPVERMRELRKLLRESYWRQTRVISKNLRR